LKTTKKRKAEQLINEALVYAIKNISRNVSFFRFIFTTISSFTSPDSPKASGPY
jgi:hypothetical protein